MKGPQTLEKRSEGLIYSFACVGKQSDAKLHLGNHAGTVLVGQVVEDQDIRARLIIIKCSVRGGQLTVPY